MAASSDVVERTRRIAESARVSHKTARERNRQKYPELAAYLDAVRKWDPAARVVRITERER